MPEAQKKAGTRLAFSAAIITLSFSASRVLGYVRLKALAYVFGSTYQTDAYISSFNVIDFLYFLLAGGALSAAFIPVFTEYINRDEKEEGWRVASNVFCVLFAATLIGITLWGIFTPAFVRFMVKGYDEKTTQLCIYLTRCLLPMVIFTVMSALASAVLNAYKVFGAPAYAYVFYNIPITVATLVLGPRLGIVGLVYGVLLGAAGLVFIQIPALLKLGMKLTMNFSLKDPSLRLMIKLFIPAMLGLSISQFNLIFIPQFFASHFSHGVVTYFNYANRIIMLPYGIFAMAVSTVVFPTLSDMVHQKEPEKFRDMLARGISAMFFFSFFSTAVLVVLREPVIELLYLGGEFGKSDVHSTANILMSYAAGLFALSTLQVVTRGFYAHQDTATPVKVGFISLGINIVIAAILMKTPLAYEGIPLATSAALVFNVLVLLFLLRRKLSGINGGAIFVSFVKNLFASFIAGIVMFVLYPVIYDALPFTGLKQTGVALLATLGISGCVFLLLCAALRVPEIKILIGMVKSKLPVGRK